jgi:hypothetical protein
MDINKRIEVIQRLRDAQNYADYWAERLKEAEQALVELDAESTDEEVAQAEQLGLAIAPKEKVSLKRADIAKEKLNQQETENATK